MSVMNCNLFTLYSEFMTVDSSSLKQILKKTKRHNKSIIFRDSYIEYIGNDFWEEQVQLHCDVSFAYHTIINNMLHSTVHLGYRLDPIKIVEGKLLAEII